MVERQTKHKILVQPDTSVQLEVQHLHHVDQVSTKTKPVNSLVKLVQLGFIATIRMDLW